MNKPVHCIAVLVENVRNLSIRQLDSPSNIRPNLPQVVVASFLNNPLKWKRNEEIKLPVNIKGDLNLPSIIWVPIIDEQETHKNEIIESPVNVNNIEKRAERMIVIRRRKMRRHKLKKLRKRMRFEFAKVRIMDVSCTFYIFNFMSFRVICFYILVSGVHIWISCSCLIRIFASPVCLCTTTLGGPFCSFIAQVIGHTKDLYPDAAEVPSVLRWRTLV